MHHPNRIEFCGVANGKNPGHMPLNGRLSNIDGFPGLFRFEILRAALL
jgi:hypothetical protein